MVHRILLVALAAVCALAIVCAADNPATASTYEKRSHSKHSEEYETDHKPDGYKYKHSEEHEADYKPNGYKSDNYKSGSRYGGSEYNGEHADAPRPHYGQRDPDRYGGGPHYEYSHERYSEDNFKYDSSSKFTKSSARLSVSTCSSEQYGDYYSLMAQVDLTCSADDPIVGDSFIPDGSCLIVYEFGLVDVDWQDNTGDDIILRAPARVGMWKADCSLSRTCLPDQEYGSPYHADYHKPATSIDVRFEGAMLYVENVYSKSANCLGQGSAADDTTVDDDGLIRRCLDLSADGEETRHAGDKSGRFERMQKRLEKKAAKWGREKQTPVSTPAKPAQNVTAKAAKPAQNADVMGATQRQDATTEYYKLDFAYIMEGTITYYDDSGAVKWLGRVQIVEDLQFHRTDPGDVTSVVKVMGSDLPNSAIVVDCAEVEFRWLNAHKNY